MISTTLYEWPESQLCHECENAVGLMDNQWAADKIANIEMAAVCLKNKKSNNGKECNGFCRRKERDDE